MRSTRKIALLIVTSLLLLSPAFVSAQTVSVNQFLASFGSFIIELLGTAHFLGTIRLGSLAPAPLLSGAPSNTTSPAILGPALVGRMLVVNSGTWTNSPNSYSYQWQSNGTNIPGATSRTFTLTSAYLGDTLTVLVTVGNGIGSTTAASSATSPVATPTQPYQNTQWIVDAYSDPSIIADSIASGYMNGKSPYVLVAVDGVSKNLTIPTAWNAILVWKFNSYATLAYDR